MSQQTVMLVEATGIQSYVFGSNQLAQNIGASELVTQVTTDWVYNLLQGDHNVVDGRPTDRSIAGDGLDAEVVYAGGGNAMILFKDDGQAACLAKRLTRQALQEAPGLQLVVKREQFDPARAVLADLHQQLRGALARRKLDRRFSTPLLGLGVTAACVYTGDPAVDVRQDQLVSAEVAAKLDNEDGGNQRLRTQLPQVAAMGYDFVYNFDDFGTKGESTYLAVIHTDGNAMGQRIKNIGKRYDTLGDNGQYVRALRRFSASVQEAAETALNRTVDMLLDPANMEDGKLGGIVPTPLARGARRLPFRPIVFGGDDVTFVCEGRLGLAVAAKYLAEFSAQPLSDKEAAHCRAGVAVVKSHYPFSRAYDLAEALCHSAKLFIRRADPDGKRTALDWHFAVSGLVLPLSQVREREYQVKAGNLLMRPLWLGDPAGDWHSWQTFAAILAEFQKPEEDGGRWAGRRNKIIALQEVLRDGREAVQLFLRGEGDRLLSIPGREDMETYGWQGRECGYFDAIEALDFYVPLKGGVNP